METKRSHTIIGKGRRLSPELKAEICSKLKRGERPYDIEQAYSLCYNTVAALRRMIGDIPGPVGRKRKLSQKALELAERRLRNGEKLCVVAADCGVHPHTLENRMTFRKRKRAKRAK